MEQTTTTRRFESNQSGIETTVKPVLRLTSSCLNRTRVELKRASTRLRRRASIWFESNQSGIETIDFEVEHRRSAQFESNQSGIETTNSAAVRTGCVWFESNQSGIETDAKPARRDICKV